MIKHLNRRLESLKEHLNLIVDLHDNDLTDEDLKKELFIRINVQRTKIKACQKQINLHNHKPELAEGQFANTEKG